MIETKLRTEVASVWGSVLQYKERPLSLSIFAELRTKFPMQIYNIADGLADLCNYW